MLKITTPNGDLLDISSCILLFKVRVIDKVAQNRYLNRDELSIDNYKFESELELIDKGGDGLIVSDQYDLSFGCESDAELVTVPKPAAWKIKHFTKKSLSMTAIDDDEISEFLKPIRLMCDVQWSRDMCPNNENKENGENVNGSNGKRMFTRSRSTGSIISRRSFNTYKSNENIQCLVYQFNYKNYRQKTELWDRLKCPWCSLKSQNLYILLKHLTLCHGLFKFKYVPGANEIRIDVFLDKRPTEHRIDPFSRLATKFCDKEPHKRKVMTGVLVNRPQRSRPKLSEFLNFETNLKRTFYHSFTGIPLKACELDVNSEDEADPLWLRQNTVKMINEFSDVNDGEKCMMKQWNLFVMKHAFISDSQIPSAVLMFVKEHGEFIITNNLYRNFIVHLSNLFDYGLLTDKQHFGAVKALQATLLSNRSLVNLMRTRIIHMRKEDVTVGKPPIKPTKKRTVLNVQTGIKRRLRSNSIFIEPVKKTKIRRTEAKKINMPTTLSPRPVRKLARVTMWCNRERIISKWKMKCSGNDDVERTYGTARRSIKHAIQRTNGTHGFRRLRSAASH